MRRPAALLAFAALALGAPLHAQLPEQRVVVARWHDSMAQVADPAHLRSLVDDPPGPGPLRELRRGFAALRLAELRPGDRAPLDRAVQAFEDALLTDRKWPWTWYGLALAKLRLHEGEHVAKESRTQPLGLPYYDGWVQAVEHVFLRDSSFALLPEHLARTMAPQGERLQPPVLLDILAHAAARGTGVPEVHLVLGRGYRQRGDFSAALRAFTRYIAAGGDASVALLERARTLRRVRRTGEAVAAYWDGLAKATPAGRRHYRADLAWIAEPAELTAFDSLPADSLVAWTRRFWALRDAESVRAPGTRLIEHLRRWNHVHEHYRLTGPARLRRWFARVQPRPGPCTSRIQNLDALEFADPTRGPDTEINGRLLDHRAFIYMRHGEPARRIFGFGPDVDLLAGGRAAVLEPVAGAPPDEVRDPLADQAHGGWEAWVYRIGGEQRLFHFGPSVLGDGPTTLFTDAPMVPDYLRRLAAFDGMYGRMAAIAERGGTRAYRGDQVRCQVLYQTQAARGRADMQLAIREDSWTLLYPESLDPVLRAYAVRGAGGGGRLLVTWAVRGSALEPEPAPGPGGRLRYRIGLRVTAVERATGRVRRLDTLRVIPAADTLRPWEHASGWLELPVEPGDWVVRAAVFQPGTARGSAAELPGGAILETAGLALSDVIPGREDLGVVWPGPDGPVPLDPLGAFLPGLPAHLWYEVSGLVPGRIYRTTIDLRRAGDRDARAGVRFDFVTPARAERQAERRTLDLSTLAPGRYLLRVTVRDEETGESVMREREVAVSRE